MKRFRQHLLIILLSVVPLLFLSCKNRQARIYLNDWEYSLDGNSYYELPVEKLSSLEKLIPGKIGYIYLRSRFYVPEDYQYENYGITVGRIRLACEFFFQEHKILSVGRFPPKKFSNGTNCSFMPVNSELIDFGTYNELSVKLYLEGTGGIYVKPFLSEYEDAYNVYSVMNFFNSTIFLILAAFLLFTSIVYLMMFYSMKNDKAILFYSLVSFFTILFLVPSNIGNVPWMIGFMDFDWFIKLFQGEVGLLLTFITVSFSLNFLGVRQPVKFIYFRLVLLVVGMIYVLFVPDTITFYKLTPLTAFFMLIQILVSIPAVLNSKGVRKYLNKIPFLGMNMSGPPPGITVSATGKIDDISLAQMEFAQSSLGTERQLQVAFIPIYAALILDIFFGHIPFLKGIPYLAVFGWGVTLLNFLFMLISSLAKVRHRGEKIASTLRELVEKNTKELVARTEELEKNKRQSDKELEMAAQVQKMFYRVNRDFLGWDIGVKFQPLTSVSGDLYDFYELEGCLRGFGLYDVSGHGLSAALVTMISKNAIFRTFRSSLPIPLSDAILRINEEIIKSKGNIENYLTGTLFRIDKEDSSKIEMVNAGSPYPIIKRNDGEIHFLKPLEDDVRVQHGMLGLEGIDVAFCRIPFTMDYDDFIVLCTDGITEAENTEGEQYGKNRLLKIVSEIPNSTDAESICEIIKKDVDSFIGAQPVDDDITLVVVKRVKETHDEVEDLEIIEDAESVDEIEEL